MDDRATAKSPGRLGHRQSSGLQPETLVGADALPGRWGGADRQQPGGKSDPAVGAGAQQLAVRGLPAQWSACGRRHEPDPVGEAQRPRSVCVSEGRADPVADAEEQRYRRVAAAQLGADLRLTRWDYRTLTRQTHPVPDRPRRSGP